MEFGLVVAEGFIPPDDRVGMDLGRVADMWPGALARLGNMGFKEGTLHVSADWVLSFVTRSGIRYEWYEDTRQWETDWSSVPPC